MKMYMLALAFLLVCSVALAADPTLDKVKEPITKIYDLVRGIVSSVAVLILLFAGYNYMSGGTDVAKKYQAKQMVESVIVGLVIIWVGPFVVEYLVA